MKKKQRTFHRKKLFCLMLALVTVIFAAGGMPRLQVREGNPHTGGEGPVEEDAQPVGTQPDAQPTNGKPLQPVSEEPPAPDEAAPEQPGHTEMPPRGEEAVMYPLRARPINPNIRQYIENGDKLIALTFDDGPHKKHTLALLDILASEDVKATFFLIGVHMDEHGDVVPKITEGGHKIGNHTRAHRRLSKLSPEERRSEIDDNVKQMETLTGFIPFGLRPPFSDMDDVVLRDANAPIILWSVDPRDWSNKDAEYVSNHIISNVKDGDIILMHDVYPSSVEAVAKFVPKLKEEGYRFLTVDELFYARGMVPENGRVYRSLPPQPATGDAAC